jgi:hypothetical protein
MASIGTSVAGSNVARVEVLPHITEHPGPEPAHIVTDWLADAEWLVGRRQAESYHS